ncbi:MAG: hypothetical protein ACI8RA_002670 [Chlamydiales bacterium]|jgi:hypothetical protein
MDGYLSLNSLEFCPQMSYTIQDDFLNRFDATKNKNNCSRMILIP